MKKVDSLPKFKSFVWAGYECTYAKIKDGSRIDMLALTKHDQYTKEDYDLLHQIGISTVREGLSWSQIDQDGKAYDFSRFEKIMQTAKNENIQIIWDLNHFDYPDYLDPFSEKFTESYAKYAAEAIKIIKKYQPKNNYLVPWNEISFFSVVGGEWGAWAPYAKNKGDELKRQLVKASIAAMNAIWQIDPAVRFIQVDPMFVRIPKKPITQAKQEVAKWFAQAKFQAWDMLAGKIEPELGGDPKYLDLIGVNYYYYNQELIIKPLTYNDSINKTIPLFSKYRLHLKYLLEEIYKRYNRPIIITETGSWGELRSRWWKKTLKEIDASLEYGIPLYGVCAYPIIDRPDWDHGHLTNSGLWDFNPDDPKLVRIPHESTIKLIKSYAQKRSS
jgi:beta-glucosidase/6-phospho-beta-glucosidase/beta-galactosidase